MMTKYSPPYTITPTIVNLIAEISELLGVWSAQGALSSPQLRRDNRIRTIQASLAIEHNSLSTQQVTAIMEGKRVLAPARDIQEVRNAIVIYEKLPHLQSHNIDHLLEAHADLMMGLVDFAGQWRSLGVGIYRDKQLIHMAPPANQVARLMHELVNWLKNTDIHPLIASCIFHYELEFIHFFADGNGGIGRLWQTLILSEWRKELAWLPVETIVCGNQEGYYQALGEADKASDCTGFIDFMLRAISDSLQASVTATLNQHYVGKSVGKMSEKNSPVYLNKTASNLLNILQKHSTLTIAELSVQLGVSTRTVERNIKLLQEAGRLKRLGSKTKAGYWQVI